ncbi:sialate O-acetylesterase [Sphingomonas sp. AOB5]|uniref:sialate O-acetylesterase n=1 Tax=Sphingomonas sp. AOB5 TaxID=3034017 RepID=UPI0023F86CBC|nr:sialate O-acetylesterase [Sphingomonas sp. AOB5]MDF7776016.1 sialate O-acetylesterase [Sphingomonas sp. AOB5]
MAPFASAQTLLHPMFQDHAVLQRDKPLPIWGAAKPGEQVSIEIAGNSTTATADREGNWRATLRPMPAGGPFTLGVTAGGVTQTISDVLIGEVWLCSGQSNMEFSVSQGLNAQSEIANANDPQMRLLSVSRDSAPNPLATFGKPVSWQKVTPASIADFSAACYFMARDLKGRLNVPFGLIDATWGGTAVNAWRSAASLAVDPAASESGALLALHRKDPTASAKQWGETWTRWWRERSGDAAGREPWQAGAPGDWATLPAFDFWEKWGVPQLEAYNGIVWYRTEITLTDAQAKQAVSIDLGIVDDMDMSFVNGIPVGTTNMWDALRSYPLAPGTLKAGVNRIVISALDTFGPGGAYGKPEQRVIRLRDGSTIPLPEASKWQYRVTPGIGDPPHAPWETIAGLSGIYNGMIAPIGPYGLRGVAWYQGEADTGVPAGYAGRLAGLMSGWRTQFGDTGLPFLIVQLANWGAPNTAPMESGTAGVRDEQRRAVAGDPNAALIVAVDLGDVWDIHPANKQEVGRRLALGARAKAYGEQLPWSGPWAVKASKGPDGVRVRFAGFDRALVAYSASDPIGFELCGTAYGSCRFVPARIDGGDVVLAPGTGQAARVRFCWGDSPRCNLYDKAGLPAAPFELAVE